MKSARTTAIIVGSLFLISYLGVIAGGAMIEPAINAPDYLTQVYPNRAQLVLGVLFEFINAAAIVGIAALLFPILKHHGEGLAIGYVGFRVIEAVVAILVSLSPLPLIELSQEYILAGAPDASYFQTVGAVLLAERSWASQMLVVFFSLAAIVLYYLLFRSKLLPWFIPIWGFLAVVSVILANVLPVPDMAEGFHPAQLLARPIVLNELFLAIWLIVKGFRPAALAAESAS